MKELVEYMVRPIVDHPDDVQVDVVDGSASVVIELTVNPADVAGLAGSDDGLLSAMQKVLAVAGGTRKPVLDLLDGSDDGEE